MVHIDNIIPFAYFTQNPTDLKIRLIFKSVKVVKGGVYRAEDAQHIIARAQAVGFDVFAQLNQAAGNVDHKQRVANTDIGMTRYIFFDLDPIPHMKQEPLSLGDFETSWGRPSYMALSGRGYHVCYAVVALHPPLFARSIRTCLHEYRYGWADKGWLLDVSTHDPARIIRVPGTRNTKNGKTGKLLHYSQLAMPVSYTTFVAKFPAQESYPVPKVLDTDLTNLPALLPHLNVTTRSFLKRGTSLGGRHEACYASCRSLKELGVDAETGAGWVLHGASRCRPPLDSSEALGIVHQVWR